MSSLFDRLVVGTLPFVPKPIVRRFARRYVAGETLDDAVRTVRELSAEGAMATVDVLGESVTRREQTEQTRDEYLRVLDTIVANRLPANVSIKPTAVGLSIDPQLARENCRAICRKAAESGTFVRIDMEDSPYTEKTLQLVLELKEEYPDVGVVVQAYMRRTLADMDRLVAAKMNVRICKGIYVEPREVAFKDRQVVIENFAAIVDKHLSAGLLRRHRDPRRGLRAEGARHDRPAEADARPVRVPDAPRRRPAPQADDPEGRPSPARLRAVRPGLVRLLPPAPQGEPVDRPAHGPDDPGNGSGPVLTAHPALLLRFGLTPGRTEDHDEWERPFEGRSPVS